MQTPRVIWQSPNGQYRLIKEDPDDDESYAVYEAHPLIVDGPEWVDVEKNDGGNGPWWLLNTVFGRDLDLLYQSGSAPAFPECH